VRVQIPPPAPISSDRSQSRAKIDGLRAHYGVEDERTLRFWTVHERLDVEHAGAERDLLAELGDTEPEAVVRATDEALEAWWGFLDAVDPDES